MGPRPGGCLWKLGKHVCAKRTVTICATMDQSDSASKLNGGYPTHDLSYSPFQVKHSSCLIAVRNLVSCLIEYFQLLCKTSIWSGRLTLRHGYLYWQHLLTEH